MTIQNSPSNTSYSHNTAAYRNRIRNAKTIVDGVQAICCARRWEAPRTDYRRNPKLRQSFALAWPDKRVAIVDSPRVPLLNSAASEGWRVLILSLDDIRAGHAEELLAPLLRADS